MSIDPGESVGYKAPAPYVETRQAVSPSSGRGSSVGRHTRTAQPSFSGPQATHQGILIPFDLKSLIRCRCLGELSLHLFIFKKRALLMCILLDIATKTAQTVLPASFCTFSVCFGSFFVCFCFAFRDRISLCTPDCPQGCLNLLLEICLSLPLQC